MGSKRTNHKFGCFGEVRQSNILISSKIPENVYFLIFIFIFFKKWGPLTRPSPCAGPLVTFSGEKNIFMSFRFSKFTLIYIHSGSAYVKKRGTAFPCLAFVVLIFGNLHFLFGLAGLQLKVTEKKCIEHRM